MLRKLILLDEQTGEEFVFPVTPPGYELSGEMGMQTVELFGVGDYAVPTYKKDAPIKIENVLLPVQDYPFCVDYRHADVCLAWLEGHRDAKKRVRFLVSGTTVNRLVYVQAVTGGEYDGTNDWRGSVTLQPCVVIAAPQVQPSQARTYVVRTGDTLWGIAKQFYGDGSLCYKLAAYNAIKNANLIYTGQVLKIPDAAVLGKTTPVAASATVPTAPKQQPKPKQTTCKVLINAKGKKADWGLVRYSYVDAVTDRSFESVITSYPRTLTVGIGTRIFLSWQGKDGSSWNKVYVDGAPIAVSGARYTLIVKSDRSFGVEWVRWRAGNR